MSRVNRSLMRFKLVLSGFRVSLGLGSLQSLGCVGGASRVTVILRWRQRCDTYRWGAAGVDPGRGWYPPTRNRSLHCNVRWTCWRADCGE